jgi:hypothetical protein
MAYLDPDIAAFQAAGEMNLRKQQLEQQRLAQLAETARYDDQLAFKQKVYEEEKRQAEKEAYAKWEKEQILNQVASEMFQNRKGEFTGVTDSKGKEVYRETPLSQAETYLAAAKEAARRGKGGVAQEFMMQGQKIAQAERQAQIEAEEQRLKNEKLAQEAEALRRKNEANYRDGSDTIESTDNAGNVRLIDKRTGEVFKTIEGVGKPSATFEKTQAAKKKLSSDLDLAISELEKATAEGGLIDKSTGSGFGALVDKGVDFFGGSTEGAVAASALAPIYDLALKMVPRFEGPQSDKDTQSYRDAAGNLANPAVPNSRKKAAALEILRLMKARKGEFTSSEMGENSLSEMGVSTSGGPPPGAVRRKN